MRVPSFDARLRLPGKTRLPLNVLVDVSDERIVITSGQDPIGDWPLGGVKVEPRSDGFHLILDQEEVVLTVADPARFARELGLGGDDRGMKGKLGGAGVENEGTVSRDGISGRLDDVDSEDLRLRISTLAGALADESVSPAVFFGRWLALLKEINRRHGQGAIPSRVFYRLNTELLELMPAPAGTPPPQPVEAGEPTVARRQRSP